MAMFPRRYDLTEELKQLQCRTLIFVGENSEFHAEAVHMTSKLDRRYCALVEVKFYQYVYPYQFKVLAFRCQVFKPSLLACFAGSSMWVARNGGATSRNAHTDGVLFHGVRPLQAKPAHQQPAQHPQPVLYIPGAPFAREHGSEAKADQDTRGV